jgi:aquaporin Z
MLRRLVVEFLGTAILVLVAVGAAVGGLKSGTQVAPVVSVVGVALAFGLVLLAMAYAFGPISGCHVNPAVTIAFMATRRQEVSEGLGYIVAQFLGALAGAGLLKYFVNQGLPDTTGGLGTNSTATVGTTATFIFEVVATFIFVGVILLVTARAAAPGFAGLAIGLSLAAVHLVGIPIDGTSVNPARSFGPAIFEGGTAINQLWVFIAAPLLGGLLAALIWPWLNAQADIEADERIDRAQATA